MKITSSRMVVVRVAKEPWRVLPWGLACNLAQYYRLNYDMPRGIK